MNYVRITLLILLIVLGVQSQSLLATRYPSGITYPTNGTEIRLGGAGVGLDNPNLGMSLNPANLGNVDRSVYSLALRAEFNKVYNGNESATLSHFTPLQLSFAFPLGKLGTVAAAFQNNGGNEFTTVALDTIVNPVTSEEQLVRLAKGVENSTSSWEIGYGYAIREWMKLGISYQRRNFYHTATSILLNADSISVDNGDTTWSYSSTVKSSLEEISIFQGTSILRLGLSGKVNKISYGVAGSFPFYQDAKLTYAIKEISSKQDISDSRFEDKIDTIFKLHFPPQGLAGIGWDINNKVSLAADFGMTFWDYFSTTLPSAVIPSYKYNNTVKIAIGAEFTPATDILAPKYWETIQYGGGFRFETLPISGDKEVALTASIGLPLGNMGYLDFAVEGGMRRSENFSENKENFLRLTLSSGGGRQWKKKGSSVY